MYSQIKNTKGEDLYIITVVSTNDIQPLIITSTQLEQMTLETNNDRFLAQLIHKEINKGLFCLGITTYCYTNIKKIL